MTNQKIKQLEEEKEKYTYLNELNIQEAGDIFKKALRRDVVSLVNKLIANKEAGEINLIKWITEIEVRLEMLTAVKYAKENEENIKNQILSALEEDE